MSRSPILHIGEILAWADAHYERTGKWPSKDSGRIQDAPRVETWMAMQMALSQGHRGLRPGMTLAGLLEKHRGVRNRMHLPKLTHSPIVRWARKHHELKRRWPNLHSGAVVGTNGETWNGIRAALSNGVRGFAKGGSLAKLLESALGVRNHTNLLPFSEAKILAWADLHRRKTGDWPTHKSGVVYASRGEKWSAVNTALLDGLRGLHGGTSLAKLLAAYRGVKRHHRGRQLSSQRFWIGPSLTTERLVNFLIAKPERFTARQMKPGERCMWRLCTAAAACRKGQRSRSSSLR